MLNEIILLYIFAGILAVLGVYTFGYYQGLKHGAVRGFRMGREFEHKEKLKIYWNLIEGVSPQTIFLEIVKGQPKSDIFSSQRNN